MGLKKKASLTDIFSTHLFRLYPVLEESVCFTESLAILDFFKGERTESTHFTFSENVLRPHFEEAFPEGPHLPLYRELSQCSPAYSSKSLCNLESLAGS